MPEYNISDYKEIESESDITEGSRLKNKSDPLGTKGIVYRVNNDGTYRVKIQESFEEVETLKQATFNELQERFEIVKQEEVQDELLDPEAVKKFFKDKDLI